MNLSGKKTTKPEMENLYEENDLVNVSIKTQTLDQEKYDTNYKPKNETNSYGGL